PAPGKNQVASYLAKNCLVSVPRTTLAVLAAIRRTHHAAVSSAATSRCGETAERKISCIARKAATVPADARMSVSPMASRALPETLSELFQFVVQGVLGATWDCTLKVESCCTPPRQV